MSAKILQINFSFSVTGSDYERAVAPLAEDIAAVPGLIWKVWVLNSAEREAGGIHLFENGDSLQAYLNSTIVAGLSKHPALSDFSIKHFDVMTEPSAITRGPVTAPAQV
jgi:hypothetical protein